VMKHLITMDIPLFECLRPIILSPCPDIAEMLFYKIVVPFFFSPSSNS